MYGLRAMEMLEKEFPEVALVDHCMSELATCDVTNAVLPDDLMLPVIQETRDTLHAFGT